MNIKDYFKDKLPLSRGEQSALAKFCHVEQPTVSRWISGEIGRPEPRYAKRIAMYYGDDPAELLDKLGYTEEALEMRKLAVAETNIECYDTANQSVPIVGCVVAGEIKSVLSWSASGKPPDVAERYVEMPATLVKQGAYALEIEDGSMSPTINPGSQIVIDPTAAFIPGKIYVVIATRNRKWLKRVTVQSGNYCLTSDNPLHPPLHLPIEDVVQLCLVDWIRAH